MGRTDGMDWTLPAAPPLRQPPLSLVQLATPLIRVDDAVAAREEAVQKLASAQAAVADAVKRMGDAPAEETAAAAAAAEQAQDALEQQKAWVSDAARSVADLQRWEDGFEYLPELGNAEAMEIFVPDSGTVKRTDPTNSFRYWYDPFEVVAHDNRSLFGWPASDFADRARRAMRAEIGHEAWQVEREFWTGEKCPTNYHLTASPSSPTTSPHRTIDAWTDPSPAPGTVLGGAVGLKRSLAALDQAIANADAGTGMIHATPYLVQLWSSVFPYLRDSAGRLYTVNMNLIVPGYGYPGTGPDSAGRDVTDGVTTIGDATATSAAANFTTLDIGATISGDGIPAGTFVAAVTDEHTIELSAPASSSEAAAAWTIGGPGGDATGSTLQWAYATEMVYTLQGAAGTKPWDLNQTAPDALVNDSAEVRAERSWSLLTNRLLRAAVLVDTETL